MIRAVLIGASITAAACTAAPKTPTWQADVLPIIASDCVRCHGYPSAFGAPPTFRLDLLADTIDPRSGVTIHGAGTMYYRIAERVKNESMPPKLPLIGASTDILENWAALATPADAIHGAAVPPDFQGALPVPVERPGNRAPTIALTRTAGPREYSYEIDDADHDLVDGYLKIDGAVVATDLRAGRGTVTLDVSRVPDGANQHLDAVLDDGVPHDVMDLARVDVTGNGAVPIGIAFDIPGPFDLLTDHDTTARPITFCANQTGITATARAVNPHGLRDPITIVAVPFPVADCGTLPRTTLTWDLSTVAPSSKTSEWVIELDVTDGTRSVVAKSPTFRVGHGPTTPPFASVSKIIADNCASTCHKTCGAYPVALPYDFNKYAGGNECGPYVGAHDGNTPGLIYNHVFVQQDMPPASESPLSADDRAAIEAWLLGGAQP